MRPRPPIGITRPLAPILDRTRRLWRRRGLVPMIWRRRGRRARPPFAPRAARPLSPSIHYAINLALTWPPRGAPAAARDSRVERLLREVLRAAGPAPLEPGHAARRLPVLIERLELTRRGAVPTGAADLGGGTSLGPSLIGAIAGPLRRAARAEPARKVRATRWRPAPTEARVFAERPSVMAPAGARRTIQPGRAIWPAAETAPRLPRFRETAGAAIEAPARISRRVRAAEIWHDGGASPRLPVRIGVEATRPPRPSLLVWRDALVSTAARSRAAADPCAPGSRRASANLVWRDPAAGEERGELTSELRTAASPDRGSDALVPARHGAAPVAAAPAPAPDVGRLVDEVVRRLERIGRDERMRRGL